MGRTSS